MSARAIPGLDAYAAALDPAPGPLDAGRMLEHACAASGPNAWGDSAAEVESFRHDFSILCASLNAEAGLSALGYRRARSRFHIMLVTRLRSIAQRTARRGLAATPIIAPLIGTGLPRTGTTFLHGLLSCDPAHRSVRAWEAALAPPLETPAQDAAAFYQRVLAFQGFTDPALTAIHPFDAALPEECVFLQEANCSGLYAVFFEAPRFAAAVAAKQADDLRWQIAQMQSLQADAPGRRWALKAPTHLFAWEELFLAFPDALVYVNHRDPAKVIPSVASLFVGIRSLFTATPPDPAAIAAEQLAEWPEGLKRMTRWRRDHPETRVLDIQFRELIAQPMEIVAGLYDGFGLRLSKEARTAMLRHLDDDHHRRAPARRYTLADYGLDAAAVDAAFADYIERYGVARERE